MGAGSRRARASPDGPAEIAGGLATALRKARLATGARLASGDTRTLGREYRDELQIHQGLTRCLDRRLSTKGHIVFPATPAMEGIILQRIEAIVRLVGRPFSQEELTEQFTPREG